MNIYIKKYYKTLLRNIRWYKNIPDSKTAEKDIIYKLIRDYESFLSEEHTSWQLLEIYKRIPIAGAESIAKYPVYYDNGEFKCSEKCWYYYRMCDTKEVSLETYHTLKNKYIALYGGWDKIDLEHTKYDGRIWW